MYMLKTVSNKLFKRTLNSKKFKDIIDCCKNNLRTYHFEKLTDYFYCLKIYTLNNQYQKFYIEKPYKLWLVNGVEFNSFIKAINYCFESICK